MKGDRYVLRTSEDNQKSSHPYRLEKMLMYYDKPHMVASTFRCATIEEALAIVEKNEGTLEVKGFVKEPWKWEGTGTLQEDITVVGISINKRDLNHRGLGMTRVKVTLEEIVD